MYDPLTDENGRPISLRNLVREDFETHGNSWVDPGWHSLLVYRLGYWLFSQKGPVKKLLGIPVKLANRLLIRNVYGVEIDPSARIGRRVCIGHHQNVQIPRFCSIGDDTLLRHNVTIGYTSSDAPPEAVPTIGKRVDIAVGATILGAITIGDEAHIGPYAIVTRNVPAGATAFAPPARVMKAKEQPADEAAPTAESA